MRIELEHISKRFGRVLANDDISTTFEPGRIYGVLGENGAGKSTLMKILSGYQPADSGVIRIDNTETKSAGPLAAIASGIGMLQQDPLDVGAFTVLENFSYGQTGGALYGRQQLDANRSWLARDCERFGFDLDADALIDDLSIPQRQQLEIVRLLALGVSTLILDEPTTGISADQKQRLFDALRQLARDDGMIVLLVSHKLEDVIALCDEVIVLRNGRLVGQQTMPATQKQLVALMFGDELPTSSRQRMAAGEVVLQVRDLTLSDGRLHVGLPAFAAHRGEVIGLAGLDGSGQEMFMRALAGLHPVLQGDMVVDGRTLTNRSYRRQLDAGVFFGAAGRLEEGLIAGLTLTEHMALMTEDRGFVNWGRARRTMQQQIKHYNIRGQARDRIEQLSGGNQQRVLMALIPPDLNLLVVEQPTRGLDVESSTWIWQQLSARREQGTAIVFSSPELEEIVAYSDRILVFYSGRIHEVPDVDTVTIDRLGHLIGGDF